MTTRGAGEDMEQAGGHTHVPLPDSPASTEPSWLPGLVEALDRLGSGATALPDELTSLLPSEVREKLVRLADGWNGRMVSMARDLSRAVEEGAKPLLESERLVEAVRKQSQQISQVAAVFQELTASISEVAANTERAFRMADDTGAQARTGLDRVGEALGQIEEVRRAAEDLRAQVESLSAAVARIHGVLDLIEDVAKQTNLLSLNAAIEAARAGEHGRGFAVVADEVRRLAGRTRQAVRDVRERVEALVHGAAAASAAMTRLGEQVERGRRAAEDGRASLDGIAGMIAMAVQPLREIAAATDQQSKAVEQVAGSVQGIAKEAADVEGVAEKMRGMVADVQRALGAVREHLSGLSLRLGDDDILALARADHILWVQRLNAMLAGRETVRPEEVTDHTRCRLGKWYYGRGVQVFGGDPAFSQLEEPHRRLHALAREIAAAYQRDDHRRAAALFRDLVGLSQEILRLLGEVARHLPR